jgi:acetyl esterase
MKLDPVLAALYEHAPREIATPVDWTQLRALAASLLPSVVGEAPRTEVASVEDKQIDAPTGPVSLRIYRPTKPTTLTVHYVHGGGWTIGDLDTVDHTLRHLCEALPAVAVSNTYRLAPEHPFPAAVEDTIAAAEWVVHNAKELGGDPGQVAIAGDSAGGNLAAVAAIALRDRAREQKSGRHPLRAQLLLYPSLDLREESWDLPSRVADADPSLSTAAMRLTRAAYVADHDADDWRLSPLAHNDLSELPRALVVVLTVDPLRDEAVAYAEKLRQAGVKAELMEFENLTHGYTHLRRIVPAAAVATDAVLLRFNKMMNAE